MILICSTSSHWQSSPSLLGSEDAQRVAGCAVHEISTRNHVLTRIKRPQWQRWVSHHDFWSTTEVTLAKFETDFITQHKHNISRMFNFTLLLKGLDRVNTIFFVRVKILDSFNIILFFNLFGESGRKENDGHIHSVSFIKFYIDLRFR